jgi:hypothetical protein
LSAAQMREIYARFSPQVFRRSRWHVPGLQAKFNGRIVERELRAVIGERRLDSPDLLTGLAIVMKRMDTGSPWVVSNNPSAGFWETPADRAYLGNRHYSLVNLLRASTAAPTYFDPESVTIAEGMSPGLFIDGGFTPHRNPALQLLMMAVIDGYGLKWRSGADRLMIISVGTGSHRHRMDADEAARLSATSLAGCALTGVLTDTDALVETLLHWFSGSPSLWSLNSEIGTLAGQKPPFGEPLMTFHRYDIHLDADWLKSELGLSVDETELRHLRRMDALDSIPRLHQLGRTAARDFVRDSDFPSAFDGGLSVAGG